MPPEPLLRTLDCVTIPVPDLDEGLRWYGEVLGHALIWRDDARGQAGLRLPDGDTELVLSLDEPYAPAWLVTSAVAATDVVVASGGRLVHGPRDVPVGVLAVVKDPFGNRLVLLDLTKGRHAGPGSGPRADVADAADAGLVRVRATYDAVAEEYDVRLRDELAGKPLDRAVLQTFAELTAAGTLADVGCGPGHVTAFLGRCHADTIGLDLSPRMIELARTRHPQLRFDVADMRRLPAPDGAWAGIVALYSIIHLTADQRRQAFAEFRRVLTDGGRLLVAFHVEDAEHRPGDVNHVRQWFGHEVELDGHYLDPQAIADQLRAAGFTITAQLLREPDAAVEYPSRRAYLFASAS